MKPLKVKIHLDPIGIRSSIEIDGIDLGKYATGLSLHADANQETVLRLDLINLDIEIDGMTYVEAEKSQD